MRPKRDILDESEAAGEGHREIPLLGQIVNHYQAPDDPSCDFAALLESVQRCRGSSASGLRARTRGTCRCAHRSGPHLPKVCQHFNFRSSPDRPACSPPCAAGTPGRVSELVAMLRDMVPASC